MRLSFLTEWADTGARSVRCGRRDVLPGLQKYVDDGTLRVEFRDLAIFGEESIKAATAARAAGEQGTSEFQHALFVALPNQGHPDIPDELVLGIVANLGMDVEKFTADWADPTHREGVLADSAEAQGFGIQQHAVVRHRVPVPLRRPATGTVRSGHRRAGSPALLMEIGYAGAFLGGVAALFSPCAAMLLPAFFAYAFGRSAVTLVSRTALFYLGLLLTLVPLGIGAGVLGGLLTTHRGAVAAVGGVALIIFGLLTVLGVPLPIPGLKSEHDPRGLLGAVALGATYGLAGACTGPLLGAVLTMAAVGGSAIRGALLLAVFGAGMVVPLVVLAGVWDRFRLGERLRPRPVTVGPFTTSVVGIVSGLLFVVVGVLFLTTDATSALRHLDAGAQFRLESWLAEVGCRVPDLVVLGLVVAGVAIIGWRWIRRG